MPAEKTQALVGQGVGSDALRKKKKVKHLFTSMRRMTKVSAALFVLTFAWLQLKSFPLDALLASTKPSTILQIVLAAGFASWMKAIASNLKMHEAVFVDDLDEGQVTWSFVGGVVVMVLVGMLLLEASYDERLFAVALVLYVVGNVVFWRLILIKFDALLLASMQFFQNDGDLFETEKLAVIEHYASGNWQWVRFGFMFAMSLFLFVLTYFVSVRQGATAVIRLISHSDLQAATIANFLPAITFSILAVVSEGWMWLMLLRSQQSISVIEHLRKKYCLTLQRPAASL